MSFELLILGSNAAAFAHKRHHTSQLLKIQQQQFLLDCGEGTQLLIKKNGVKLSKIDHVLISHLHGDHYFGLIGLLSTMHLFGRKKELFVAGPVGLKEIITLQLRYSETALNYAIRFVEVSGEDSQMVLDHSMFTVETIPMDHRVPCYGYLFKEKPKKRRINRSVFSELELSRIEMIALKNGEDLLNEDQSIKYENKLLTLDPLPSYSYAYCSDTRYKPSLAKLLQKVDMLYHESTFANDMEERAAATYHSTAQQAATFAKEASVKRLLLGHFSARYREIDVLLDEAQDIFPQTELAIEGQTFKPYEK